MNESEPATDQTERSSLVFLFSPCNFLQEVFMAILKCFGVESKAEDQDMDPSSSNPDEKSAEHDCQSQDSTGSQSTASSECSQQQAVVVPPSTDDDEFACPPPTSTTNPNNPPTQNPDLPTDTARVIGRTVRSKRPPINKGRGGQINYSIHTACL